MSQECGYQFKPMRTNRCNILVVLALASLISFSQGCDSEHRRHAARSDVVDLNGLWFGIEKDGTYWEVIYTDNLVWNYSLSFGVIRRQYSLEGNLIRKYNKDCSEFLTIEILESYPDSIVLNYNDFVTTYHRISMEPKELDMIVMGDSARVQEYTDKFLSRMQEWYSTRGQN